MRRAGLLGGRVAGTPRVVYAHGAADVPGNAVKGCSGWRRAAYGSARRTQQRANDSTCTRYQSRGRHAPQPKNACNAASYRRNLCRRAMRTTSGMPLVMPPLMPPLTPFIFCAPSVTEEDWFVPSVVVVLTVSLMVWEVPLHRLSITAVL